MAEDNPSNESSKSYKQMSADEVYEKTKQATGKGVAAAAGSVDGFTEKMDEHQLAEKAKGAIQKTGEGTRDVAGTAAEELQKTKEHVSNASSGSEAIANPDE